MPKPTFQHVFPVAVSNLALPAAGQVNVDDAGAGVLVVEAAATGCAVGVAGLVSSVFGVDIRTSQEVHNHVTINSHPLAVIMVS